MTYTEIVAVAASIIYVILAAKENIWCWVAAAISVLFYIYICVSYRLYAETGLQIFYLVMAFYGWWQWRTKFDGSVVVLDQFSETVKAPILQWKPTVHIVIILAGIAGSLVLGYFLNQNTNALLPYPDSFVTVFSVFATFMVTRKILENWLYWIAIDSVGIYVYWQRDLYLTALLYLAYTIIAVYGYFHWKKEFIRQSV